MSDSIPTRNYWAIALTYSDLLMVSRSSLQLVMKKHPRAWQVIRRRILR